MCLNTEFKRNNRIHSERTGQYQKKKTEEDFKRIPKKLLLKQKL